MSSLSGRPVARGHLAGDRSNIPKPSLFIFLLVASLLLSVARSGHSAAGERSISGPIRLPWEVTASDGDVVCAPSTPPVTACPVRCFRTDPVCGADGLTYWCGCAEAACAGARVAKLGFCEVGNGGDVLVAGQALLLVHIVWLIVLGLSVLFGLF